MSPKKIDAKAKATAGYANADSQPDADNQPDTTSDEMIAHNNRNKPTKEEREAENKKKALQRSEVKKKASAEKRGEVFIVKIEFQGQVYEVEVMASDTVADIRRELMTMLTKTFILKKKDMARLRFYLGDVTTLEGSLSPME